MTEKIYVVSDEALQDNLEALQRRITSNHEMVANYQNRARQDMKAAMTIKREQLRRTRIKG